MRKLSQLCCGELLLPGRLSDILSILDNVITRYGEKALFLIKSGSDEDRSTYGSFVARKLLESSLSAILARIDPSRFLILQEYQQRAGERYKPHERHPASVAWSGDIIPEKSSDSIWSNESPPDKFIRSLLGGHLAEVVWPKAIEKLSLDESDMPKGIWLEEIGNIYEGKLREVSGRGSSSNSSIAAGVSVLGVFRSRAQDNYSALSKGVHLEFVVDESIILDSETVVEHMLTAVKIAAQLGYLSNYMDSVFSRIETQTAAELLLNVEESFL